MSQPLSCTARPSPLRPCAGFYGKIPSRGDFVRSGLPQGFVDPWDRWLQDGIATSQAMLGDTWQVAWLQAAIWSFLLAPGLCGPDAVIGLWLPSVDRVGRYFPLTLAAVIPDGDIRDIVQRYGGFLVGAERAGLAALEEDIGPEELAARTLAASTAAPADPGIDPALYPSGNSLWWTPGAPLVPACAFALDALPDAAAFAMMLDANAMADRESGI